MEKKLKLLISKLIESNLLFIIAVLFLIIFGCADAQKKVKVGFASAPAVSEPDPSVSNPGIDSVTNDGRWDNPPAGKLVGTWNRSDAGYVLEISSTASNGKLEAVYLNPNPINIEKAVWSLRDKRLFVDIILRDVNYPGSIYTLQYSSLNDFLIGDYYQAVEGKNYAVLFLRKK